jgi:O-antigen/teichoic acid export membrane protein
LLGREAGTSGGIDMNRLRRVINNTAISLLGQIVTWVSTMLLTIAYGRFLGDVKFGELFLAITYVSLVGFPLEFCFNQQITRDVAQEPDKALRYLSNVLLMKLALWLVLYGVILLLCWPLGYPPEERVLVAICGFILLGNAISNIFRALHYAFEWVIFPVVGSILEKAPVALIGILLLRHGAGVQAMAFILVGGAIASAIWQAWWFFALKGMRFDLDLRLIRSLIGTSIPFLIYGALTVIYYRLDTILLSLMTNIAVVGWYSAGYRLFDTLSFIPNLVIAAILYPIFAKFSITSQADLKMTIEKSTNFLLFCSIPIATGLIVAAPNIIGFLYHRPEFSHTIPVLQALAPGLFFLYINFILCSILMSTRQEKKMTVMAAIALVFNLVLNLILIPRYEHIGAALVTSLTELLLLCIAAVFIPRQLWPLASIRVGLKALVASFVMALAIWILGTFHIFNIFAILLVATPTYFGVVTLLRTIPREDVLALYSAIRRKAAQTLPVEENTTAPEVTS